MPAYLLSDVGRYVNWKDNHLVSAGEANCVKNLGTSPREVMVGLDSFSPKVFNGKSDRLSLRILVRMGTTKAGTSCGREDESEGVRLYFDGAAQPTLVEATLAR